MASKRDHGDGGIDERGPDRWRLRWRVGDKRYTKSFHGTKRAAQTELRRLLKSADDGAHVAPDKVTLAEYLRGWLDGERDLQPKTLERYRELVEQQILPHLGSIVLQDLRSAQIDEWHKLLLKRGGWHGNPLSATTVGHAHRVLHRGLERALALELVVRNVASVIHPPKITAVEIEILTAEQITVTLAGLKGHYLLPIAILALGTGMRRGELCALRWGALDLDAGMVRVERSLGQTRAGIYGKAPKTRAGSRAISLPPNVVAALREHRRHQLELRLQLGLGRLGDDDLVFCDIDGSPHKPNEISRTWGRVVRRLGLPVVGFHALRHSSASALIAAGLDVGAVARRLGHANPSTTLRVYTHQFSSSDSEAAAAIEKAMTGGR